MNCNHNHSKPTKTAQCGYMYFVGCIAWTPSGHPNLQPITWTTILMSNLLMRYVHTWQYKILLAWAMPAKGLDAILLWFSYVISYQDKDKHLLPEALFNAGKVRPCTLNPWNESSAILCVRNLSTVTPRLPTCHPAATTRVINVSFNEVWCNVCVYM